MVADQTQELLGVVVLNLVETVVKVIRGAYRFLASS